MAASTRTGPRSTQRSPRTRTARRTLAFFFALILALYALIGALSAWNTGQWTPKLGLDLAGGKQVILKPVATNGKAIDAGQLEEAVNIMRKRVDGSGVAEAEVSTQGDNNIVVALPAGTPQSVVDSLKQSSQMQFRAVLAAEQTQAPAVQATSTPSASGTPAPASSAKATASASASATSGGATASASASSAAPAPLSAAQAAPAAPAAPAATTAPVPDRSADPVVPASGTATPAATASPSGTGSATGTKTSGTPKDASDPAWITPAIQKQFDELNCADPKLDLKIDENPAKPIVTCADDRTEKYILGPAELTGQDISNASSGLAPTANGGTGTTYEVRLSVNADKFAKVSKRLVSLPTPRNRFAMVLDGESISTPVMQSVISNGDASITGSFTQASSEALAQQLKFGALPMSFSIQTQDTISPQLGSDQMSKGLLAGLVGFLLVIVYSLFQYRALGLVTVASLIFAGILTYGIITFLGWDKAQNFRLSMAGITGLILSIGMTADSFIVYFERVRDEIREGRSVASAVEAGWKRARGTVLISDAVNLIAAVVLYLLASSNVRGFAYTLGLTTIIDILIVFCFTHPLVVLLSHTKFFGSGHKMSGFDPESLGVDGTRYVGRGRFVHDDPEPEPTTPRPSYTQEGGAVL